MFMLEQAAVQKEVEDKMRSSTQSLAVYDNDVLVDAS